MLPVSVGSYQDVIESVRAFNRGLEEGKNLENQLSYFRSWYYIPELDAVGPSKFIGYKEMTVTHYMRGEGLDGKVTESIMGRWFDTLIEDTPEARYVANLVEGLLSHFNKRINRKARFNAPRGWKLDKNSLPTSSHNKQNKQVETPSSDLRPIVEVFWRAFLGLYPEDQDTLAERILKYRSLHG